MSQMLTNADLSLYGNSIYVINTSARRQTMQVVLLGAMGMIFDITQAPNLRSLGYIAASKLVTAGNAALKPGAASALQNYFNLVPSPAPYPDSPMPPAGTK